MLFDTHCHLTDPRLSLDRAGVLARALAAGVTRILSVAVDLDDAEAIGSFADGVQVWGSVGVHPGSALTWNAESAQRLRARCAAPAVAAIGEIGLDFLYDETHPEHPGAPRPVQEAVFEEQLALAAELGLPVIIHNRIADERLIEMITPWRDRLAGGVFHCFGSPPDVARRVLDLGFHLGFTGIVTFKNAAEVRDVVALCPMDRLLIETDAPYLAPVPHRGKTNEPAFVAQVAAAVAAVKGVSVEEIAEITTANAWHLFHL